MIKCDFCKKDAEYNLQENWILYKISKKENYRKKDQWLGNENNHYCKDHAISMGIINE